MNWTYLGDETPPEGHLVTVLCLDDWHLYPNQGTYVKGKFYLDLEPAKSHHVIYWLDLQPLPPYPIHHRPGTSYLRGPDWDHPDKPSGTYYQCARCGKDGWNWFDEMVGEVCPAASIKPIEETK